MGTVIRFPIERRDYATVLSCPKDSLRSSFRFRCVSAAQSQ